MSDTTNLDFFDDTGYHFVSSLPESTLNTHAGCCIHPGGHNFSNSIGSLSHHDVVPNIWTEVDSFAKVFYTSILADLGQISNDNILANGALLEHFTSNITNMAGSNGPDTVESKWLKAGPARHSYEEIKNITGPLQITDSVIYTQYLCLVPELRSTGSLLVAILIADLVFLQALWKVLNWITVGLLEHSDPQARFCEGCLRSSDGVHDLLPTEPGTATIRHSSSAGDRAHLLGSNAGHAPSESQQQLVLSPHEENRRSTERPGSSVQDP
jgi:hypothetical protein